MNEDPQIRELEQKVEVLLSSEPSLFLVEVRIKPSNNVKVFIDGDQGISIDKLVHYNRRLYRELEESAMFPGGDFSLEVSSPGLDEPLKLYRQYVKNIGREVEVMEKDGGRKEGKLLSATETEIVIEEERRLSRKGILQTGEIHPTGPGSKRKEIVTYKIPFENIKATKVQVKFG